MAEIELTTNCLGLPPVDLDYISESGLCGVTVDSAPFEYKYSGTTAADAELSISNKECKADNGDSSFTIKKKDIIDSIINAWKGNRNTEHFTKDMDELDLFSMGDPCGSAREFLKEKVLPRSVLTSSSASAALPIYKYRGIIYTKLEFTDWKRKNPFDQCYIGPIGRPYAYFREVNGVTDDGATVYQKEWTNNAECLHDRSVQPEMAYVRKEEKNITTVNEIYYKPTGEIDHKRFIKCISHGSLDSKKVMEEKKMPYKKFDCCGFAVAACKDGEKTLTKREQKRINKEKAQLEKVKYNQFLNSLVKRNTFCPKRIIVNGPCTIVFWSDGTKTIVRKSEGEIHNVYNAFCAALAKKMFGNNTQVCKMVKEMTVVEKKKDKKEADDECKKE